MKYVARSFAICLTTLLSTVPGSTSRLAAAQRKTPGQGQQQQQAIGLQQSQMQTQQLQMQQLQKQVEELQKQLLQKPEDNPTSKEKSLLPGLPVLVSIIAAFLSFLFFLKNRELSKQIADRTVTIEAQKLLVEINKQYISHPPLFAIYDDYPGRECLLKADTTLLEKVKALGYLKLNVFELVYSVMLYPGAWEAYFEDSLKRCKVVRDELAAQLETGLYNEKLINAYKNWVAREQEAARKEAQAKNPPQTPAVTTGTV